MIELPTERREADAPVEGTSAPDRAPARSKPVGVSGKRLSMGRASGCRILGPAAKRVEPRCN